VAGSNYEVNIQLNVRKINQQLNNLERRIKKLNDIAMGQKGVGKAALKTERDKLALATKTFRREQQITKEKAKQNKLEKDTSKVVKKAAVRPTSKIPLGPSSPLNFDSQGRMLPGKGRGTTVAAGGGSGVLSGALISGAFPLLFGQGVAGGVTGFAGGALGGLLGGQTGGFAGGLVATALLTQIQQADEFRTGIDRLNVSIQATGGVSNLTAKQVTQFGKSLGLAKEEALAALNSFKQFGGEARIALNQVFGKESIFNTFSDLKNNRSILDALPGLSKELSLDQAEAALQVLKSKNAREAESFLLDGIINKQRTITKEEAKRLNFFQQVATRFNPFKGKFVKNDPDSAFFGLAGGGSFMDLDEAAEFRGEKAQKSFDQKVNEALRLLEIQKEFNRELERQAIIKAPVDELNRLIEPLTQIDALSKNMGNSFADSFKGIVKGSMTAQEALRNLFQRTADHFIDMAAQILAAQVRSGIMGIFSNMLGGNNNKLISSNSLERTTPDFNPFKAAPGQFYEYANGGRPPVGRPSIVGEKGPELFVPDRAGTIVPNHSLGGSTTVVVNVDASGSSVEGDEEQGRELGRVISAAVQSEILQQKRPGGLLA
tara:strand:+ start:1884 stop:3692 length:1809 start_codon:yes stop_codon:yes gene_type:complete